MLKVCVLSLCLKLSVRALLTHHSSKPIILFFELVHNQLLFFCKFLLFLSKLLLFNGNFLVLVCKHSVLVVLLDQVFYLPGILSDLLEILIFLEAKLPVFFGELLSVLILFDELSDMRVIFCNFPELLILVDQLQVVLQSMHVAVRDCTFGFNEQFDCFTRDFELTVDQLLVTSMLVALLELKV